jgi:hypothetical protein
MISYLKYIFHPVTVPAAATPNPVPAPASPTAGQVHNPKSAATMFIEAISHPLPPALLQHPGGRSGTPVLYSGAGSAHLPQCGMLASPKNHSNTHTPTLLARGITSTIDTMFSGDERRDDKLTCILATYSLDLATEYGGAQGLLIGKDMPRSTPPWRFAFAP